MSGTIAQLGIEVNSGDAVQAATDLDKLTQAGAKAEAAAGGVTDGFNKAGASAAALAQAESKLAESAEDAKTRLLNMAKASLEASQYNQSLTVSVDGTSAALGSGKAAAVDYAAYQKTINANAQQMRENEDRLAASTKQAAAATGVQADGLQALLAKINPALGSLQKLDDLQASLSKHKAAGNISGDDYKAFTADIEASRAKLTGLNAESAKTATGFSALGLNTKLARENVLQLGNALAEGNVRVAAHNILEIGTNAGASALKFALLAAPILAVGAALGVVAYGYSAGAKEQDEYNKSLILTGNYAGVSAVQLSEMAKQVSATVGTTGAAAEALATLAGNGKIAGGAFVEITTAAVSMQEATGKAISETIADFVKIADDPVKASIALNDQYHYLTESVYSQIAALELQGDHAGAVKLATDQYADAINQRTPKILENLGLWEKAYNAIARAADGIKNIGRSNIDDEIETAKNNLADAQNTDGLFQTQKSKDALIAFSRDQLTFLQDKKAAQIESAKLDGDSLAAQDKATKAAEKIDAADQANLSTAAKRNKLLDDYQKQLAAIRIANPTDKRLAPEAVAAHIQDINDKNKDPKVAAGQVDLSSFNDAQNALKALQDTYSNTEKQLDASQKAGLISADSYATQKAVLLTAEKDQVTAAYDAEIIALEAIRDKSTTTAEQRIGLDQKIADARTSQVKAQKDADSQLEVLATQEQGRVTKQKAVIQSYIDALVQQNAALKLSGQRAALGVGQGDRQNTLTGQLDGIADKANQERLTLARDKADASRNMSADEYNQKLAAINKSESDLSATTLGNYDAMSKAQSDWSAGATSAYANYLESASNVAGQTKSLFTNAFDSMDDAIVNFALTGKLSFSDFAKSIIADLAKIAEKQASSAILSSLFGAGVNALAGGATASATAGGAAAGAQNFGSQFDASAGTVTFGGGRASGGGVDPNTLYQVNEKGPELFSQAGKSYLMTGADGGSVTPLNTGGGARMSGSGSGSGAASGGVSVTISIASNGQADVSSNQSGLESFGTEIGNFVTAKYKELEAKSLSSQGNIRKAITGRA